MEERIPSFVRAIVSAVTFEEAAELTLHAVLELASSALSSSVLVGRGRILRGIVHLRPDDGYRRLFVAEAPHAATPSPPPSFLPSATLWRWVSKQRCAVSSDVSLGLVKLEDHSERTASEPVAESFDSNESQAKLLHRDATHVLALPLPSPGGEIAGMVSIEAECASAVGRDFVWGAVCSVARVFVDIAAPYLAVLPLRAAPSAVADKFLPVVGASMASLVEMLRVFARQEETILLSGPTGAGKSRLARWCHEQSPRSGKPFETLDLATVPEDLQMAELFGWRRGAFTGAVKDTQGCIARAEGGTLFIDEIDKLSLRAQAGLLRVLEERKYRPLGDGAGEKRADVRFVIGTNAPLGAAARAGRFREDLYYRINVLPLRVPPLRERQDEVRLWAEYMLARRQGDTSPPRAGRIAPDAEQVLRDQPWPGNLRQLDNIVRRAYALALMDFGAESRDVSLRAQHIERALRLEDAESRRSVVDVLLVGASAFAAEAERYKSKGEALDLDHAEFFKGLVLAAASERFGGKEEAFKALGRTGVVQNRNHQKLWRVEMKKVEAALRALGEEPPASLRALLEPDDG